MSTPTQIEIPDGYVELADSEKNGQWIPGAKFLANTGAWKDWEYKGVGCGCRATKINRIIVPKPAWSLPKLPEGMKWHREDWTQDMLPDGWRPLLMDEVKQPGDYLATTDSRFAAIGPQHYGNTVPAGSHCFYRTRRPLPAPQTADGWIEHKGWKEAKPPVHPDTLITVKLRRGEPDEDEDKTPERADEWDFAWLDEGHPMDIVAYKIHTPAPEKKDDSAAERPAEKASFCVPVVSNCTAWLIHDDVAEPPEKLELPAHLQNHTVKMPCCGHETMVTNDQVAARKDIPCPCGKAEHYILRFESNQSNQYVSTQPQPIEQPNLTNTMAAITPTTGTLNTVTPIELPAVGSRWAVEYYDDGDRTTIIGDVIASGAQGILLKSKGSPCLYTPECWTGRTKTQIFTNRELKRMSKPVKYDLSNVGAPVPRLRHPIVTRLRWLALGFSIAHANNPVVKATASAVWESGKAFFTSYWS